MSAQDPKIWPAGWWQSLKSTGGEGRWTAPESSPPSYGCISATVCVLPQFYVVAEGAGGSGGTSIHSVES